MSGVLGTLALLVAAAWGVDDGYSCKEEARLKQTCREQRDDVSCMAVAARAYPGESPAEAYGSLLNDMLGGGARSRFAIDVSICEERKGYARERTLGHANTVVSALSDAEHKGDADRYASFWTSVPGQPGTKVVYYDGMYQLPLAEVGRIPSLHGSGFQLRKTLEHRCERKFRVQAYERAHNRETLTERADGARFTCEFRGEMRHGLSRWYQQQIDTIELVYEGPLVTPDTEGQSSPSQWHVVRQARKLARVGPRRGMFYARLDGRIVAGGGLGAAQLIGFRWGNTPHPMVKAWTPHLEAAGYLRQTGVGNELGVQTDGGAHLGISLRASDGDNGVRGVTAWARLGRATNAGLGLERGAWWRTAGLDLTLGSAGGNRGSGRTFLLTAALSRAGGTDPLALEEAAETFLSAGLGIELDKFLRRSTRIVAPD